MSEHAIRLYDIAKALGDIDGVATQWIDEIDAAADHIEKLENIPYTERCVWCGFPIIATREHAERAANEMKSHAHECMRNPQAKRIEELEKQASTAEKFHNLAIAQRDLAWHQLGARQAVAKVRSER